MEFEEVYNNWIGIYKAAENSEVKGNLEIFREDENFCYSNIDVLYDGKKFAAKLFVGVEEGLLVLWLDSYEESSEIDKFQKGDVVLCLKNIDGKILTMINLGKLAEGWSTIFEAI